MKRKILRAYAVLFLLAFSLLSGNELLSVWDYVVYGSTVRYIAQSAGVFSGGSVCNGQTAITPATFNGIVNSGGDVNWICGTITGGAGSTLLTPLGSGTAGHLISLNWDTGAVLTAPYWNTSVGAIDLDGLTYWNVNGMGTGVAAQLVSGGNPIGGGPGGGANGIIQATANGTSFANQQDSEMIHISNTDHITIQNLWLKDNFVRVANTAGSAGFNAVCINGTNATNVVIANNWNTNCRQLIGVVFTVTGGSGLTISTNYTFGVEVPTALASVQANTTWTGELLSHNHWAGGVNQWDDPTSNSFHHDGGFHNFCQATNCHILNVVEDGDLIDGIWGNDQAYYASSGGGTHITTYGYPEETGGDTTIVNTVINRTAGDARYTSSDNGDIFAKIKNSPGATVALYNDTIIGPAGNSTYDTNFETDGQTVAGNAVVKNVIFTQNGGPYYLAGAANTTITARTNDYFAMGSSGWNFSTFAQWQAAGQDAAPTSNGVDPKLNADGTLQSGSSAIGIATNLTSLGILNLSVDKAGNARPTSGNWDAGAYQFSGSAPSAPTGVGVVIK